MNRLTFLYQMDLPHRAVAVYTYLYDRANKKRRMLALSKNNSRAVKDLKKAGLIKTEQRYREKGGKSTLLFRLKQRTDIV